MAHTLLLVDDDPIMLDTLKDVLEGPTLEIKTATKVAEAIAILEQGPVQLIVTDYNLPDGTGLDLARKAKTKVPELKIILMTGNADLGGNSQAWAGLVDQYLIKPVDPEQLQKLIQQLLAEGA